eukprot:SM000275S10311  [mRNA]  locus=s275:70340:90365:+ [translate_table: standard]
MIDSWLSGLLARQLTTYLDIDEEELLVSLLSGCVQLRNARVLPEAINENLSTSPLIVVEGTLAFLRVVVHPLEAAVVQVVADGLHLTMELRSADDPWWQQQREVADKHVRRKMYEQLDPKGCFVHKSLEQRGAQRTSAAIAWALLEHLSLAALSLVEVEILNACIRVPFIDRSGGQQALCLEVTKLFMERGSESGAGGKGGLAGASLKVVLGAISATAAAVTKICHITGLSLYLEKEQMKHKRQSEYNISSSRDGKVEPLLNGDIAGSRNAQDAENKSKVEDSQKGSEDKNILPEARSQTGRGPSLQERQVEEEVPKISVAESEDDKMEKVFLLLPHNHKLHLKLEPQLAVALNSEVDEVALHLDIADIEVLLDLSGKLTAAGYSSPDENAKFDNQTENGGVETGQQTEPQSTAEYSKDRSARGLWRWCLSRVRDNRQQVNAIIVASSLRKRYTKTYEAWLVKKYWGQASKTESRRGTDTTDRGQLQQESSTSRYLPDHKFLDQEADFLEKSLPAEAIVLARHIARQRVLLHKDGTPLEVASPVLQSEVKLHCALQLGMGYISMSMAASVGNQTRKVAETPACRLAWQQLSASLDYASSSLQTSLTCGAVLGEMLSLQADIHRHFTRSTRDRGQVEEAPRILLKGSAGYIGITEGTFKDAGVITFTKKVTLVWQATKSMVSSALFRTQASGPSSTTTINVHNRERPTTAAQPFLVCSLAFQQDGRTFSEDLVEVQILMGTLEVNATPQNVSDSINMYSCLQNAFQTPATSQEPKVVATGARSFCRSKREELEWSTSMKIQEASANKIQLDAVEWLASLLQTLADGVLLAVPAIKLQLLVDIDCPRFVLSTGELKRIDRALPGKTGEGRVSSLLIVNAGHWTLHSTTASPEDVTQTRSSRPAPDLNDESGVRQLETKSLAEIAWDNRPRAKATQRAEPLEGMSQIWNHYELSVDGATVTLENSTSKRGGGRTLLECTNGAVQASFHRETSAMLLNVSNHVSAAIKAEVPTVQLHVTPEEAAVVTRIANLLIGASTTDSQGSTKVHRQEDCSARSGQCGVPGFPVWFPNSDSYFLHLQLVLGSLQVTLDNLPVDRVGSWRSASTEAGGKQSGTNSDKDWSLSSSRSIRRSLSHKSSQIAPKESVELLLQAFTLVGQLGSFHQGIIQGGLEHISLSVLPPQSTAAAGQWSSDKTYSVGRVNTDEVPEADKKHRSGQAALTILDCSIYLSGFGKVFLLALDRDQRDHPSLCQHLTAGTSSSRRVESESEDVQDLGASLSKDTIADIQYIRDARSTARDKEKNRESADHQWLLGTLSVSQFIVQDATSGSILNEAVRARHKSQSNSPSSAAQSMKVAMHVKGKFQGLSVTIQDGLVVLDPLAMVELLHLPARITTSVTRMSRMIGIKIGRSSSGWEAPPQPSRQQDTGMNDNTYGGDQVSDWSSFWKGEVSVDIQSCALVLARGSTTLHQPPAGLLLQADASMSALLLAHHLAIKMSLERLSIHGLQAHTLGESKSMQMLQSPDSTGDDTVHADCLKGLSAMSGPNERHGDDVKSSMPLHAADVKVDDATSNGPASSRSSEAKPVEEVEKTEDQKQAEGSQDREGFERCILDRLQVLVELADAEQVHSTTWRGALTGRCQIRGGEIVVTTSEFELLVNLVAPLLALLSTSSKKSTTTTQSASSAQSSHPDGQVVQSGASDTSPPNGKYLLSSVLPCSVVAIYDCNACQYFAVEDNSDWQSHTMGMRRSGTRVARAKARSGYRLVGERHYSVGKRALFQVKYVGSRRDWFFLESLQASSPDGEPLKVKYESSSGMVEVASTNTKSWELWRLEKGSCPEDNADEDFTAFECKHGPKLALINKKSKRALSFVGGTPTLVDATQSSAISLQVLAEHTRSMSASMREESGCMEAAWEDELLPDDDKAREDGLATCDEVPANNSHRGFMESANTLQLAEMRARLPEVLCQLDGPLLLTLLYEPRGDVRQLLPLARLKLQGREGIAHVFPRRAQAFMKGLMGLEYFDSRSSHWESVIKPVSLDLSLIIRTDSAYIDMPTYSMSPVIVHLEFGKVDALLSEPILDMGLFVAGALDLAQPYSIKYSPAYSCMVKNNTAIKLCCSFDTEDTQRQGVVRPHDASPFLIRHTTSRKEGTATQLCDSISLKLQANNGYSTEPLLQSLFSTGVRAVRTRLLFGQDNEGFSPGPYIVLDVSKPANGLTLSVSPLLTIRNLTGLPLELSFDKPGGKTLVLSNLEGSSKESSQLMRLESGDVLDDIIVSFQSLDLQREHQGVLAQMILGDDLLSIRPAAGTCQEAVWTWSERVSEAVPVHLSGWMEKVRAGVTRTMGGVWGQSLESTFGTLHCESESKEDIHFLLRTTCRDVSVDGGSPQAWVQQRELAFLPTLRVQNFLTSTVGISLVASSDEAASARPPTTGPGSSTSFVVEGNAHTACAYADPEHSFLIVHHMDLRMSSAPIPLKILPSTGQLNDVFRKTERGGEVFKEVLIGTDDKLSIQVKMDQAADGVSQVTIKSKHTLRNSSQMSLLCSPGVARAVRSNPSWWRIGRQLRLDWPAENERCTDSQIQSGGIPVFHLKPGSSLSWLPRGGIILLMAAEKGQACGKLDLNALASTTELTLLQAHSQESHNGKDRQPLDQPSIAQMTDHEVPRCLQLGVKLVDAAGLVQLAPRHVIVNQCPESLLICQDGLQGEGNMYEHEIQSPLNFGALPDPSPTLMQADEHSHIMLGVGQRAPFHAQANETVQSSIAGEQAAIRLKPKTDSRRWDWSGPLHVASLGNFSFRIRSRGEFADAHVRYAVAEVIEEAPSLVIYIRPQRADAVPYRIENELPESISFHQKMLGKSSMATRQLGTILQDEDVNLDKLRSWKLFRAFRKASTFNMSSILPATFTENELMKRSASKSTAEIRALGYEIYAEGPTRVLRISEEGSEEKGLRGAGARTSIAKIDMNVATFGLSILEPGKEDNQEEDHVESGANNFVPFLYARTENLAVILDITSDSTACQVKVQRMDIDAKWTGAPQIVIFRPHRAQSLDEGTPFLHAAFVMSNSPGSPLHLRYAFLLIQTLELNIDGDTLMRLVPFSRSRLQPYISTASQPLYFEQLEVQPIKIVASFEPGSPRADLTSAQETVRALLQSIIKVPAVKGRVIELNGISLQHALLTYTQLAVKFAQHYSWYGMRAVYLARGSELLPPAFASLFDDSAASSIDAFFDPANLSSAKNITLGAFNLLRQGIGRKGKYGTTRYLGDFENKVKEAGSNLAYAVVTEVSDSVLRGAEAAGVDGLLRGFRRGILNIALKPDMLRTAVRGGAHGTCRIQLDRSVGTEEVYLEGYLQATLDAIFKQEYLRVKFDNDQVVVKNLPPNSTLKDEIVACVRHFLVGEGLLSGETSQAAALSLRRLHGEQDKQMWPAMRALCEQLAVIIVVRSMRRRALNLLPRKAKKQLGLDDKPSRKNEEDEDQVKSRNIEKRGKEKSGKWRGLRPALIHLFFSSSLAYLDGRVCRRIPYPFVRRVVSSFLLSFVNT